MYTWNRFPFVRFSFAAIAGILLYDRFPNWWSVPIIPFSILLSVVISLNLCKRFTRFSLVSFPQGLVCLAIIGFTFGWIAKSNQSLTDPLHWRNVRKHITAFEGVVDSDVRDKSTIRRYSVGITVINSKGSTERRNGQLHLYIKKDAEEKILKYGDVIRVYASPAAIAPPTNPNAFDYSSYVARQQIHGQCFVSSDQIAVIGHAPDFWILDQAFKMRKRLQEQIKKYLPQSETQAIAMALLIGVKDYLSKDLKKAYASTGAMHILAVSGLHVGILYMILLFFLKPLEKWKGGNRLIAVIVIMVIWGYTFLTGMSPSVLRAATMFSIFITSKAISRESNIYNSLGIAAFSLMMLNPNLIFEVGFQLSFLAVAGIVYLQPKIYHLLYVKNYYLEKIWMITAVSIAAQISTVPLTIYYFHQFPTYFFLSNLIVIPGAMIIMVGGVMLLTLGSLMDVFGSWLGEVIHWVIWFMNWVIQLIEQMPGSLITWLYFDEVQMLLVYAIIILLLTGIAYKSSFYLSASIFGLGFLFIWGYLTHFEQTKRSELVIYNIAGTVAIDKISGKLAELFVSDKKMINEQLLRLQIDPFRQANGLDPFDKNVKELEPLEITNGAVKYGTLLNTKILVLDSFLTDLNIHQPLKTDILLINNQSVKNTDWLLKTFDFNQCIIGSDNSYYYTKWLQRELVNRDIISHSLLQDGSWKVVVSH